MSSRARLCTLLDKTGALHAVFKARRLIAGSRLGSPYLTVLTYHRVASLDGDYVFDRGVVDVGPDAFREQLGILNRHFSVVGVDELVAFYEDGTPLPPNPAVITFDDGYMDNVDTAAPILREYGMRGIFFIATSYIENRRVYWWDRINYLLHKASPELREVVLEYPTRIVLDLKNDRSAALKTLLQMLKIQFDLNPERLMDELAEALGVHWDRELETQLTEGFVMTWDDVRRLRDMGMDVQSHTRSHRPLQTVAYPELVSELKGAREDLEAQLEQPVTAISYPIGNSLRALGPWKEAVRDAGYKIGFTNQSGPQPLWRKQDPLDVRRIAMEPDYQGALFRGVVAIPQLAYGR